MVVSDGGAGMENQALGLAEAVARLTPAHIDVKRVRWRSAFDWLPVALKATWMLASAAPFPAEGEPWPDLWIATGRATLPLSLAVRRSSGGKTFVVQTQDPRLDPALFDLVVAPAHDSLTGTRVVSITGSPHRITPETLAEAAPAVADRIAAAIIAANGSLMLTFSRRTPDAAKAVMTERLSGLPGWIWDGQGANPLFAFLNAADQILVTEDSANMAAEAASTGKPVHVLTMVALTPPGKFERLHADLEERGATRPFDGVVESWTYEPLAETERAAREVLRAMGR